MVVTSPDGRQQLWYEKWQIPDGLGPPFTGTRSSLPEEERLMTKIDAGGASEQDREQLRHLLSQVG
jgi:hypothetical protein